MRIASDWNKCILDKSGTGDAECHRKVANERKVAGTIRFLINPRGFAP